MLGDRPESPMLSVRFGLRGEREYGSCAPYRSGLAMFSRQTFCTMSMMTRPCSVPYAMLKWGKRTHEVVVSKS